MTKPLTFPWLGDYMVTATPGFFGWAIRKFTRSKVNHAAVYVGGGYVIEACPSGAKRSHLSEFPHAVWACRDLTWRQRGLIAQNALALVGTPYNFADIAAQAIVRLFGWHAPKWALRRLSRPDRLQCAQLVDLVYERAGVHLFRNVPDGLVAPSDLYDLIEVQHGNRY